MVTIVNIIKGVWCSERGYHEHETHCIDMLASAEEIKYQREKSHLACSWMDTVEEILDFSDWMGIPIHVHPIFLQRLKKLLSDYATTANSISSQKGNQNL